MINPKKYIYKFISWFLMFYAIIALVIGEFSQKQNIVCGVLILLYMVLALWRIRKHYNLWFMTFMMFFFNYSIIMNDYLPGGNEIVLPHYGDVYFYGIGVHLMLLFVSVFFERLIPKINKTQSINLRKSAKNNYILVIGAILVMILIIVFGISRETGGGYTVHVTALYEYIYLVAFMGLYYSNHNIKAEMVIVGLIFVAILQDLMYGGRITSLQLIVLLIIYYEEWLSKKIVILGCMAGMLLFNIIGIYRSSYSWSSINISSIITSTMENRFALDTAYYAWYASITNIVTTFMCSMQERLSNLWGFVLSVLGIDLEGYILLPTLSNLKGNSNYGGSIIFTYAYFWAGLVGVIILSVLMAKTFEWTVKRNDKPVGLCFVTVLCVTFPRWYLYSPLNFFRSMLLSGVCFGIFYIANKLMKCRPLI